jgi:hypothetical protein
MHLVIVEYITSGSSIEFMAVVVVVDRSTAETFAGPRLPRFLMTRLLSSRVTVVHLSVEAMTMLLGASRHTGPK